MRIDEPQDQDDINVLLQHLDHPPPPVSVESIIARANAGRRAGWGKWAAGILLLAGLGGVAYALPGSPVPGWIDRVIDGIAGVRNPPAPPDSVVSAPPQAELSGIAVAPGDQFRIQFTQPVTGGVARITMTEGSDVVVRAPVGTASFSSETTRLVIDNSGAATQYEIEIPRTAPQVEIVVEGHKVFTKTGGTLTGGQAQADGSVLVDLGS